MEIFNSICPVELPWSSLGHKNTQANRQINTKLSKKYISTTFTLKIQLFWNILLSKGLLMLENSKNLCFDFSLVSSISLHLRIIFTKIPIQLTALASLRFYYMCRYCLKLYRVRQYYPEYPDLNMFTSSAI